MNRDMIEVNYRIARDHGWHEADKALNELRSFVLEDLPGVSAMRAVGHLKAEHPIALADCFAITLASSIKADLLTGDPEIIDRAGVLPCRVVDLR